MSAQATRKRKRAAIACTTCHNRRVRCNVATQGVPCTNCAQDGTTCAVYGRPPAPKPHQPIRPRESVSIITTSPYPPTPSNQSTNNTDPYQAPSTVTSQDRPEVVTPASEPPSPGEQDRRVAIARTIAASSHIEDTTPGPRQQASRDQSSNNIVVPYHAGEAEGLEFLADICSPNRSIRGPTYIITKNVYKREFSGQRHFDAERLEFPPSVCRQLIQCFFRYIYPSLPIISAGEFLEDYTKNPKKVSKLLLWSIFFAAASYVNADVIKEQRFKSRKSFKEFCYQRAKAFYNSQLETDKTNIISAAVLLAFWYVDLEDLDGCWHWIGVAISLCHGSGFHREPNYNRLTRCPFPPSKLALWRRIWWCVYNRDIWLAFAFGRPVRLHVDDCDIHMPCLDDVLIDLAGLSNELRDDYLPSDLDVLAHLWINVLSLSMKLEDVLVTHYRPRRPPLSLPHLEATYGEILQLLGTLPSDTEKSSTLLTLHLTHLNIYYNAVIIALHRSYMIRTPEHLTTDERIDLQQVAVQRCKRAAAGTASALNKLITLDMIDLSPSTLVTAMMSPMQIHFYEFANAEGLARQHAFHNLDLHMIILTHLKKTYWAADMTHNLFNECLKTMEASKNTTQRSERHSEELNQHSEPAPRQNDEREEHLMGQVSVLETLGLCQNPFEEFYYPFNPFDNLQSMFDSSTSLGWEMGASLNLEHPPTL